MARNRNSVMRNLANFFISRIKKQGLAVWFIPICGKFERISIIGQIVVIVQYIKIKFGNLYILYCKDYNLQILARFNMSLLRKATIDFLRGLITKQLFPPCTSILMSFLWTKLFRRTSFVSSKISAKIFKQSMSARNRVGTGLSYRPARLLAE